MLTPFGPSLTHLLARFHSTELWPDFTRRVKHKLRVFLTCRSSAHYDEIVNVVRNDASLRTAAGVLQVALWPDEDFEQPHEQHKGWAPARAGQGGPRLRHRTVTAHPVWKVRVSPRCGVKLSSWRYTREVGLLVIFTGIRGLLNDTVSSWDYRL